MAHLTLYDFVFSPFARKVRIAMAEKGITCERVTVDLIAGEQRKPEYLAVNPHGRVPALVVDGKPIYESSAIIEYLEETHPHPALLPKDALERARVRMIEETCDNSFLPAVGSVFTNTQWKPPAERDPKAAEEGKRSVAFLNEWLNTELAGRPFLGGDMVSAADIAALCGVDFQQMAAVEIDAKNQNLIAWHERMKARPSVNA